MAGGYIKLHRKITEWEWYSDTNTKIVFLHLLLTANIKDTKYMGMIVPRGSLIVKIESKKGEKNLCDDLHLTPGEMKTALKHLENSGEITRKTTNKFTLINVVKYRLYQDSENGNNNQTTIKQQPIDNLTTSIEEEGKEGEEEKEEEPINTSTSAEPPQKQQKKKKPSKPKPVYATDSIEYQAAQYLINSIRGKNPNAKLPQDETQIQNWCHKANEVLRLDHKPVDEFKRVLKFAATDAFWSANILSMAKFRAKYDQLYANMQIAQTPKQRANEPPLTGIERLRLRMEAEKREKERDVIDP